MSACFGPSCNRLICILFGNDMHISTTTRCTPALLLQKYLLSSTSYWILRTTPSIHWTGSCNVASNEFVDPDHLHSSLDADGLANLAKRFSFLLSLLIIHEFVSLKSNPFSLPGCVQSWTFKSQILTWWYTIIWNNIISRSWLQSKA